MTEIAGADFSMARPTPSALVRAGFRFVLGYCSTSPAKNLSAADVRNYLAAGLSVGLIWETTAGRALDGAAAGAADGAAADRQLDAIGYPADCVLFFAVDQAVGAAQINGPIRAYATAFDAATKRPAGVYGSFLVVETLVTPGQRPVRYGWQTAAWSAGNLSSKANIYQRAVPSGHWPAVPGTDENVLCLPLPLAGPLHPAPAPHPIPIPTPHPAPEDFDMPYSQWPQADKKALCKDIADEILTRPVYEDAGGGKRGTTWPLGVALQDVFRNGRAATGFWVRTLKKLGA